MSIQTKQNEWHDQWSRFQDNELFLFQDWIAPITLDHFKDKDVLECGCGGGQHTSFVATYAKSITAVDLNTADLALTRNKNADNVKFIEADIAEMTLNQQYDIVYCIGVIHHTNDPDATFHNLYKHCKPGGIVIVWTYSSEGNFLVRYVVEPIRKLFLTRVSRTTLLSLSNVITALLYSLVYSVYLVPLFSFLPYFEYFKNFRKLSFKRNSLNVFDKLNAPQTIFTTKQKCYEWFNEDRFEKNSISIRVYAGVSYSISGTKVLKFERAINDICYHSS